MEGAWGPTNGGRKRSGGRLAAGRRLTADLPPKMALLVVGVLLAVCSAVALVAGGTLDLALHLFYLPILLAGVRFGPAGAAVVAVVATLVSGPAVTVVDGLPADPGAWAVRGAFFLLLGLAMAWVSARRRGAEEAADRSRQTIGLLNERLRYQEREMTRRREATARVQEMVKEDHVSVVVQPIADLLNGTVVGVEALGRFNAAAERTPDVWFSEANEVGLGLELELKVVRKALALVDQLPPEIYLAVNLSPDTIGSPRFAELMDGLNPERVVLEVTEHAPVENYEGLARALEPFRARGCRLAVDDAGAGFASFRHILRLNPDIIKLDMTLTRNIDQDPARRALASGLISFASDLGARIIAEGVETTSELGALRALGVRLGQGYYLARPEPLPFLDFKRVEKILRPMSLAGGGSAPLPGQDEASHARPERRLSIPEHRPTPRQAAPPETPPRRLSIPEHRPEPRAPEAEPGGEAPSDRNGVGDAMRARPQAPAQQ